MLIYCGGGGKGFFFSPLHNSIYILADRKICFSSAFFCGGRRRSGKKGVNLMDKRNICIFSPCMVERAFFPTVDMVPLRGKSEDMWAKLFSSFHMFHTHFPSQNGEKKEKFGKLCVGIPFSLSPFPEIDSQLEKFSFPSSHPNYAGMRLADFALNSLGGIVSRMQKPIKIKMNIPRSNLAFAHVRF